MGIKPLDDIQVRGRSIRQPVLTVTGEPSSRLVTVRLDDDANPAFWLELVLTVEAAELLADIARGTRQP